MGKIKHRRDLTLKVKLEILKEVDAKTKKKKDIAAEFQIPRSTLSSIIKHRDKLSLSLAANGPRSRKRMRTGAYEDVERAVMEWLKSARSQGIPISGPILKEKAENFAFLFDHKNFKASTGWLSRFKARHDIVRRNVCGEGAAVDTNVVLDWQNSTLPELLEDWDPKNVFNADESGLFYKMLPDKTLTFRNDSCQGGKRSKERLTVMFCANQDGSRKMKLLVIGKSKNPRCFKGLHSLPVQYEANPKAWMNTEIFNRWLLDFDKAMSTEDRKVLLLVDNCSSHMKAPPLKSVTLHTFPPNCTAKLQPLDQGIIQNAKCLYRRRLVQRTLINKELAKDPSISIKDAIYMLYGAWNEVLPETIKNCFRKAGFGNGLRVQPDDRDSDDGDSVDGDDVEGDAAWQLLSAQLNLPEAVTFQEYANVDSDLQISTELTDDDALIVNAIKGEMSENAVEDDDEADDNDHEEIPRLKSTSEAVACIDDLKVYLQARELPEDILQLLLRIESFVVNSAFKNVKQKKITDFLL